MSVQPQDVEPDEQRARTSSWQSDPNFRPPPREPWSVLSPTFISEWGRDEKGRPDPEHVEIVGPTGSGKTYLMCKMLQERVTARNSAAVLICTKPADKTISLLGWPIVDSLARARDDKLRAFVFWPKTSRMGTARKQYQEQKITGLLHELWRPDANIVVAFDEVGYVESLSGESRALVQQYWREGRSLGITVCAMKQRPQGALRDMHSETYWTVAFKPKDRADAERFAELFGAKRDWLPVIDSLSKQRRDFIIQHTRTDESFISWVDDPLKPAAKPERETPHWWRSGAVGGR
jgi:nucleoside-triphosphatase THEP1